MARKNIYELLAENEISITREYKKLQFLFSQEKLPYSRFGQVSLKKYIDESYFRSLDIRGSSLDVDSLMKELGIVESGYQLDDLLCFCEFILAIIPEEYIVEDPSAEKQANTIVSNILYILDKTNHTLLNLNGEDYGHPKYVIIEKNKAATEAAELIEDENVAIEVLEYNRFVLKGDLSEKKRILNSIAQYIEPLLKSRKLQKAGYGQLESDAGFLANNFHIRHNNKTGSKANEYIVGLADNELEYWYDKAYNVFLNVITLCEQIETSSELKMLKGNYHWKI